MHAMQHATLLLVLTSKTHALSADPSKGFAIFARNVMRGNQRCFSRVADDLAQRGLPDGARVLDLGASAGEPSLTIASRGFRVVSTDFAPPNKNLGEKRAAAFGLSDRVEFHTADAQDLSRWGDGTFDACVGTYVLMFTPDVERVCREVRRVLKPGAPFITTVWQPPARVDICVEINQCVGCTRKFFTKSFLGDDAAAPASVERQGTGIATPSSRCRVDGVEDDAAIQHERAVKF